MVKGSKILVDRDYFIHVLAAITAADKLIQDYKDPDSQHLVESDITALFDLVSALDDIIQNDQS